jgi:hypothetical protein
MIRTATGILALILLLGGTFLYAFQPDADPFTIGMMVRVGALLGAIWLAYPQLEVINHRLKGRVPAILIAALFICLAIIAAKPNLGRVVVTVVTIALGVGGALKWMTKMADGQPPKKK